MNGKEIVVFFTGGTIGMAAAPGDAGAVPSENQDQLLTGLSAARQKVNIKSIAWANLPSPHITPETMLRLAHDLDAQLKRQEVLGAVVLHGTDLMPETAFFLELALISRKPVILTGSMLHQSQNGYDGIRNLEDSLTACLAAGSERGVLLQMGGEILRACDAVKINSTALCPMVAQRHGYAGRVVDGEACFYRQAERMDDTRSLLPRPVMKLAEPVALLKCFPGMDANYLNYLLNDNSRGELQGLVIEAFGAGNVPPALVGGLEKIVRRGTPVILTTRCIYSGVHPIYGYAGGGAQLIQMGLINGYGLTSDKALLLLKVALGCGCDKKNIDALCAVYGRT